MYSVIYEDENFLIVNKSSGILSHATKYEKENLIDSVKRDRKEEVYLIHRIDKYTSGIILLAKNKKVLKLTQELFSKNLVEKIYLAIVTKNLPAKKLKINLSLGRNKNNKLMFSNKNAKNYKPSCTEVFIIDGRFIQIFPRTGRTHQIRAHLFEINCPILNDPIYGDNCFFPEFGQYLHAYQINFECPITKKKIFASADLPREFLEKLKELNLEFKGWKI